MSALIEFRQVCKTYQMGDTTVRAADHISMRIEKGEFVAIVGQSGSGKSTCMNIIGCLDVPTSGSYILSGQDTSDMDEEELAHIRNREIGFIFQSFQLLPRLNALENVELPLVYAGVSPSERRRRAKAVLERVGLENKMKNYPNQLSGGQQQRVAIARAVVTEPTILLADEPTGTLDQATGRQVMQLFRQLHDEGRTIIMITHDVNIAANAQRIVHILDGRLWEGDPPPEGETAGAGAEGGGADV